LGDRCARVAQR